jgi:hypothetical protein
MVPRLVRNTLVSGALAERLLALPRRAGECAALSAIVQDFEGMRARASEIQTETSLVKPILRVLGYVFESKPKFFEEKMLPPDFALFRSEEERAGGAPYWGTKEYYARALAVLLVKRYGRNLQEGIGGFHLELENRIPLYQSIYLSKKSGTPWSILTNGKSWLLLKRPSAFEKQLVEIDLEKAVADGDEAALHLFCQVFSCAGLGGTLGAFLEEERRELAAYLTEKRRAIHAMDADLLGQASAMALPLYTRLFPGCRLTGAGDGARYAQGAEGPRPVSPAPVREHDQCDIFSYLFVEGSEPEIDLEETIVGAARGERTKESLLSLRVLDMTPGFGVLASRLVETVSYLSFLLPYGEKRSFIAEWENEPLLHRFILGSMLHGVENQVFPLDVLQNGMRSRFGAVAPNYRLGNPLLSVSADSLEPLAGAMDRLKDMERLSSTLSSRIKEDAAVKGEVDARLRTVLGRVGEVMDLATASYFDAALEPEKINELAYNIEGDEELWQAARRQAWYSAAREMAAKKHFFHMEVEFPFLLNDGFDLIFTRPALPYIWDERFPPEELARAHLKRAMTYLKQTGTIILTVDDPAQLVHELRHSRRYAAEAKGGVVLVRKL